MCLFKISRHNMQMEQQQQQQQPLLDLDEPSALWQLASSRCLSMHCNGALAKSRTEGSLLLHLH
jgi:hypothetical protein